MRESREGKTAAPEERIYVGLLSSSACWPKKRCWERRALQSTQAAVLSLKSIELVAEEQRRRQAATLVESGSLWTVEEKRKRTPKLEPCLGRCVRCVGLVDGGRAEGKEAPRRPRPVRDLAKAEISLFVRRTRFLQATHRSLPPRHLEKLDPPI